MKNKKILMSLAFITLSVFTLGFVVGEVSDPEIPMPLPEITIDSSGKASSAIEIDLPEGRGQSQPSLLIQYSASLGSGLLGEGWGLSGIDQIRKIEAPSLGSSIQYSHTRFGYLYQTMGEGLYRSEPDMGVLFQKSGDVWIAKFPDGNREVYGATENSSLSGDSGKRVWGISSRADSNGNEIQFLYKSGRTGILVPEEILYVNQGFRIQFQTESRYESFSQYFFSQIHTRDNDILTRIDIFFDSQRIRRYEFEYTRANGSRLSKELLTGILRTESTNLGHGSFYKTKIHYSPATTASWQGEIRHEIHESYAVARVPYHNRFTCFEGYNTCLTANTMTCIPASVAYLSCMNTKATLQAACNDFTAKYFIPCTAGVPTAFSTSSLADVRGNGSLEFVRMIGNEDHGFRIQAIQMQNGSLSERTISGSVPSVNARSLQSMGFGDVNGDGKTDFAYSDGEKLRVMFSNGSSFGGAEQMGNVDVPAASQNMAFDLPDMKWKGSLVDLDGDGRSDYIRPNDDHSLVIYLSYGNGFHGGVLCSPCDWHKKDGHPKSLTDINGDGSPDFVTIEDGRVLVSSFASNFQGLSTVVFNLSEGLGLGEDVDFNHWFNDMNGDGKPDLITVGGHGNNHYVRIFLNTGTSFVKFYEVSSVEGMSKLSLADLSDGRAFPTKNFVDINGDGVSDLVVHSGGRVYIHYWNPSSGTFSKKEDFAMDAFLTVADFDGDGNPDILGQKANDEKLLRNNPLMKFAWDNSFFAPPDVAEFLEILALIASLQIDQYSNYIVKKGNEVNFTPRLTRIEDGKSKQTSVTYDKVSNFSNAIRSGTGSYPSLPATFERELVRSVVSDQGGGIVETRNFSYDDIRFRMGKPEDRAMYGARVQTTTHGETGIRVVNTFSQSDKITAGQPIENRVYATDGSLVEVSGTTYSTPILSLGKRSLKPVTLTENKYRNGDLIYSKTVNITYDLFGYPTQVAETLGSDETITTNLYTHLADANSWRLGQQTSSAKRKNGILLEETNTTYDTKGNVTSQTTYPGTSASMSSFFTYDSFGNPVFVQDQLGRTTVIQYDNVMYKYPVRVTNTLGHVTEKEYDFATGLELSSRDPNGVVSRKFYDGFQRLASEVFPGNSTVDRRYVYAMEETTGKTAVKVITNDPIHGNVDKTEVFDSKGRPIRVETKLLGNITMVELSEYDSLGRLHRKTAPFAEGISNTLWSTTEYTPSGDILRITEADGSRVEMNYSGLTTTVTKYSPQGNVIQTNSMQSDMEEKPLIKTTNGLSVRYDYDSAGRNIRILDPENIATVFTYDAFGRRTSQRDDTSGLTTFQYDAKGNVTKQTDARGMSVDFEYDALDRIVKTTPSDGSPATVYTYDQTTVPSAPAFGKVTSVQGEFGKIELGYDSRGTENYRLHSIDEIKAILRSNTDSLGRVTSTQMPDGTRLRYGYAPSGHLIRVGMDTADGTSINHTVTEYNGPIFENGKFYLERKSGNGVVSKIEYDPIYQRPTTLVTRLGDGDVAQSLRYNYDEKGNIEEIRDNLRDDRNQSFTYDAHNRVTRALGKYGIEEYEYSNGGNLLRRGAFTMAYENPNHRHAVTRVTSQNTGAIHYGYDASGNMISKNGATLVYDAHRRLKEITKADGIKYSYTYDASGLRVKKSSQQTGEITYSLFNGQYEIANSPGTATKHTVYIRGIKEDLLAQITREDASLLLANTSENRGQKTEIVYASLFPYIADCLESGVGCKAYLANTIKIFATKYIKDGIYHPEVKQIRVVVAWGVVLLLLFLLLERNKENSISALYRYVTPILTTAILFTFTSGCGIFLPGGSQGDAPWMVLASGINANTPSVRDDGSFTSSSGTSAPFAVPVSGMYFVHNDHLGSVSFLTNGRGSLVAGGEFGGKSDIQYKPYGEIDRTHSSGPDITKFKYTGQEEDKETGLMYYKARYYDPAIARFLQADDLVIPSRSMGMNRMMYVEGNPVGFTDPSGRCANECNIDTELMFMVYFGLLFEGKSSLALHSPGHTYSGSGNWDYKFLNNLYNKDPNKRLSSYFILGALSILLNEIGYNNEEIGSAYLTFLFFSKGLRTKPTGKMDEVSQRHDDSASTTLGAFGNANDDRYHSTGAGEFVRGGLKSTGMIGKWNAGDAVAFAIGVPGYAMFGALRGAMYDVKTMNKKNFHKNGVDLLGKTGILLSGGSGIGLLLAGTPTGVIGLTVAVVGASFIGRSPLVNAGKPGKWRL